MRNALSIDVEDYFQVSAFEECSPPEQWDRFPLRVVRNTSRILDMLDAGGVKATFFVLGWVAERAPELVKEIARRGHEVASHGYGHRRVSTQTRQEFRADVRRSKSLIENLTGSPVYGYRAPSYSISRHVLWAFDELLDAGYRYDSSVFPVRHDLYGIPDWPSHPFRVVKGNGGWEPSTTAPDSEDGITGQMPSILEMPITTLTLGGRNIPIAGGGYFRFFPYAFTRWGLRRINRREKRSFIFYLHPWEMDPDQPRMAGAPAKSRFRHYLNLHRTEERFRRLLGEFRFTPVMDLLATGTVEP
ncbi:MULTISPECIES: XrtA system polysaccharide deacetylase [Geobacter]|uniref:XrtA system polysaccharide deacetylase n=1 Tax=Geobacter TaxID=28231 RepID=UPI0025734667|nr:XrtA system polysaccharide deacetylase [Geobacter sulfurreducens]BEH10024.1 DUF3473 domain-containing protein [Geobacter sulfurreducens subsp. ethanolicus]BET58387.1 DUF3473 domain-containing protein [Geobacter sp. 60473]HML77997.1 DUF3473 domain-containing protein [Geobacter sulfurreducens]